MEDEKKQEKESSNEILERIKENTEKKINQILDEEIRRENIDYLSQLVDIHKDIANEEYWCIKEENMKYRNYGNYPNDAYGEDYGTYGRRRRDSRGRYRESGEYGRRYRGHDMMNDMEDNYSNYMESHNRYGTGKDSTESLEYMLQSAYDFMKHISNEASSQEEVELVKEYAEKISRI